MRIGCDDHEEKLTSLEAKQQAITVGFTYIYIYICKFGSCRSSYVSINFLIINRNPEINLLQAHILLSSLESINRLHHCYSAIFTSC